MQRVAAFDVSFYDEDTGAVAFETASKALPDARLQLLTLALFTLRQLVNSGRNVIAKAAAGGLTFVPPGDYSVVLRLIGNLPHPSDRALPSIVAQLNDVDARTAGLLLETGTWGSRPFDLVAYERPGDRRFLGTVEDRDGLFSLKTQLQGFGLLGRGLGYYAPASIALLLCHFLALQDSKEWRSKLTEVVGRSARAWLDGRATLANQSAAAAALVDELAA